MLLKLYHVQEPPETRDLRRVTPTLSGAGQEACLTSSWEAVL